MWINDQGKKCDWKSIGNTQGKYLVRNENVTSIRKASKASKDAVDFWVNILISGCLYQHQEPVLSML